MRIRVHRPASDSRPWRESQGLSLFSTWTFVVDPFLERAPALDERRDALLPILHGRQRAGVARVGRRGALARLLQLGRLDRDQALGLGEQPFAPRLGLRPALVDPARFGGEDLDLLLHRSHRAALRLAARLRLAQRLLDHRHGAGRCFEVAAQQLGAAPGRLELGADALVLGAGFGFARAP